LHDIWSVHIRIEILMSQRKRLLVHHNNTRYRFKLMTVLLSMWYLGLGKINQTALNYQKLHWTKKQFAWTALNWKTVQFVWIDTNWIVLWTALHQNWTKLFFNWTALFFNWTAIFLNWTALIFNLTTLFLNHFWIELHWFWINFTIF